MPCAVRNVIFYEAEHGAQHEKQWQPHIKYHPVVVPFRKFFHGRRQLQSLFFLGQLVLRLKSLPPRGAYISCKQIRLAASIHRKKRDQQNDVEQ